MVTEIVQYDHGKVFVYKQSIRKPPYSVLVTEREEKQIILYPLHAKFSKYKLACAMDWHEVLDTGSAILPEGANVSYNHHNNGV